MESAFPTLILNSPTVLQKSLALKMVIVPCVLVFCMSKLSLTVLSIIPEHLAHCDHISSVLALAVRFSYT